METRPYSKILLSNYGILGCPPLRFGQVLGAIHTGQLP